MGNPVFIKEGTGLPLEGVTHFKVSSYQVDNDKTFE
jgi:hypothetical protein